MIEKKHDHTGMESIDFCAYSSNLNQLNAGYKVACSMITLILCIGFDQIWISLFVIITMGIITTVIGKLDLHRYLAFLSIPILFMICGSAAIAMEFGKQAIGDFNVNLYWGYLSITKANLLEAGSVTLKALGAVSAVFMMTLSTPASEIIVVLRKMHVPKLIIELMNMIYRFIFIIVEVYHKIHRSAESRLGYVDFKTSLYTFGHLAGNLLILSLKNANSYYDALDSRGYNGELLFLEEDKPCTKVHIIVASLYFIVLIMLGAFLR